MAKKNIVFFTYFVPGLLHRFVRRMKGVSHYSKKRYRKRTIRNAQQTNDYLATIIDKDSHFFISRLGDVECRLMELLAQKEMGLIKNIPFKIKEKAAINAGMFSVDDKGLDCFFRYYTEGLSKVTGLCVWFNFLEDYLADTYSPASSLLSLDGLEAYLFSDPWLRHLKNKKILVVSPFSKTILSQYQKRSKLFDGLDTLPDFSSLSVIKAPLTMAGEKPVFPTWEETLLDLYRQCKEIDYDVAIIGCGSYGLPLGSLLFSDGKSVIHSGGVTQVYFGISGRRWEQRQYMNHIINQYWTKPSAEEKPINSEKVEHSCYW